ncbi:MAG TPA: hypothetical protein VK539_20975 [Myxococcaceae bacterium]|nr:hypothetical protein [Myxococcaceae bacterium]
MKISKTKLLVAGLLAGSLTFMGCKSNDSAQRTDDAATGTGTTTEGTGTGTGTQGTGTGTGTDPGTGGSGPTKQSDDNIRHPYDDHLRTPEDDTVRGTESDAASESEPGVHGDTTLDPNSGMGGSGTDTDMGIIDEDPNVGGNSADGFGAPDSPMDEPTPEDRMLDNDLDVPEGSR